MTLSGRNYGITPSHQMQKKKNSTQTAVPVDFCWGRSARKKKRFGKKKKKKKKVQRKAGYAEDS